MTTSATQRQQGLSLIELMVSLTLGMMIIVTIGYVYVGASRTFRSLEALSRMQENARYAIERISFDLRMAGFMGCSSESFTNVLNNPEAWQFNLTGLPLIGYQDGVSVFPSAISDRLRGDAFTIIRADNSHEYIVTDYNSSSAQFKTNVNHDLGKGAILVATDCKHSAMFQMSNIGTGTNREIVHNSGGGQSPGNYTKGLGKPTDASSPYLPAIACTASPKPSYCKSNGTPYDDFTEGARIYKLSASTYYIGSHNNEPVLYREALSQEGGNAVTAAEEIVEGVQDMQLTYGVDTTATADGSVDKYVTAAQVEATAPDDTKEEDWARVLSVRISLLMVSRDRENTTNEPQSYTFNGSTVTPSDYRLRKTFTTTIAVRNRL